MILAFLCKMLTQAVWNLIKTKPDVLVGALVKIDWHLQDWDTILGAQDALPVRVTRIRILVKTPIL